MPKRGGGFPVCWKDFLVLHKISGSVFTNLAHTGSNNESGNFGADCDHTDYDRTDYDVKNGSDYHNSYENYCSHFGSQYSTNYDSNADW